MDHAAATRPKRSVLFIAHTAAEIGLLGAIREFIGQGLSNLDYAYIAAELGKRIELLLDAGPGDYQVSTVVAFEDGVPRVVRPGKGDLAPFGG